MKKVENLVEESNRLFEEAELAVEDSPEKGHALFIQGISRLLQAFLMVNGVESTGTMHELFSECQQVEPKFEEIEEAFDSLIGADPAGEDPEEMVDWANEIWDFVVDYVSDDDCH